jgi:hypothetical protein
MFDKDDLAYIVNKRDQPVLITAHVEHRQIDYKVGGAEISLQSSGILPPR